MLEKSSIYVALFSVHGMENPLMLQGRNQAPALVSPEAVRHLANKNSLWREDVDRKDLCLFGVLSVNLFYQRTMINALKRLFKAPSLL